MRGIEYSRDAAKAIQRMDGKAKRRVKEAVEGIPCGDIKPIKGNRGLYRLRVGVMRIIFSYIDGDVVLVEKAGYRGDIYKHL